MVDSTLALLTPSGALTGTELFYSDTGSADVKVTANQLKTFTGDVHGPASSTDNGIPRFDGTTGKIIQTSPGFTIADDGIVAIEEMLKLGNAPTTALVVAPSASGTHYVFNLGYTFNDTQLEGSVNDFHSTARIQLNGTKTSGAGGNISPLLVVSDIIVDAGATIRTQQAAHFTAELAGEGRSITGMQALQVEATIDLDDTVGRCGYVSAMEIYSNINACGIMDAPVWGFVSQVYSGASCTIPQFVAALFTNVSSSPTVITENIVIDVSNGAGPGVVMGTSKGINIQAPGGTAVPTDHTGLWIGDQSTFGTSTSHNIHSKGADSKNVFDGYIINTPKTVSSLLAASAAGEGAKAFVTDSTVAGSGNFGAVVAGGSTNNVPVYSDGTNWRIG